MVHRVLHHFLWRFRAASRRRNEVHGALRAVGSGFEFDPSLEISFPERISIGDHVYLGARVQLHGRGGLEIQDHVIFGPEVVVLTSMHNYKGAEMVPYDRKELLRPVVVERCVWAGLRAVILPGVHIGEGSVIGAGAVVTKSCDPGSIVVGNPARVIGNRDMTAYWDCVRKGQFYLLQKQLAHFDKVEVMEPCSGV